MDHVVSPEDVEPVEVIDLDAELEMAPVLCAAAECDTDVSDSSFECDDCKQEFCGDDVVACFKCDDWVCTTCANHTDDNPYNNSYCGTCFEYLVPCCNCSITVDKESDDTYYCDSHDKDCCSNCYAGDDKCSSCDESSSHAATMGACHAAPWEHRGVHDPDVGYDEDIEAAFAPFDALTLWGVDNTLSLNEGAADFYLLDVVEHNVDCGEIVEPMLVVMAEEAKTYRQKLVERYDPTFCGYVDMAVGGELRYHRAVGGGRHLPEERTQAWRYWKLLRERGGVELLLETAQLFEEINGGSVGGQRWADAARLLHARLTGRITPAQWVDRVFTLQHNGGAFTNKITWAQGERGAEIHTIIGPAHHQNPTDFKTLTTYASSEARSLFADWWPAANKNRMRWGYKQWLNVSPMVLHAEQARRQWFSAFVTQGWTQAAARQAKLNQWDANPSASQSRFAAFYAMQGLNQYGVTVPWSSLDKQLARRVVHHTLDPSFTKINPSNMGRNFPEYLALMCDRVMACCPTQPGQVAAFEYLDQRGFIVPTEYRTAAGMSLQLQPF